jgi:hypothetical protein
MNRVEFTYAASELTPESDALARKSHTTTVY